MVGLFVLLAVQALLFGIHCRVDWRRSLLRPFPCLVLQTLQTLAFTLAPLGIIEHVLLFTQCRHHHAPACIDCADAIGHRKGLATGLFLRVKLRSLLPLADLQQRAHVGSLRGILRQRRHKHSGP